MFTTRPPAPSPELVKADPLQRFGAFMVDLVLLVVLPSFIIIQFVLPIADLTVSLNLMTVVNVLVGLKEIFGRSPGKVVFHLHIRRKSDYAAPASVMARIARGFLLLTAFEPFMLLFNSNGQRLADIYTDSIVLGPARESRELSDKELVGDVSDDMTLPTECLECGFTIPAKISKCPKCGWSYSP